MPIPKVAELSEEIVVEIEELGELEKEFTSTAVRVEEFERERSQLLAQVEALKLQVKDMYSQDQLDQILNLSTDRIIQNMEVKYTEQLIQFKTRVGELTDENNTLVDTIGHLESEIRDLIGVVACAEVPPPARHSEPKTVRSSKSRSRG